MKQNEKSQFKGQLFDEIEKILSENLFNCDDKKPLIRRIQNGIAIGFVSSLDETSIAPDDFSVDFEPIELKLTHKKSDYDILEEHEEYLKKLEKSNDKKSSTSSQDVKISQLDEEQLALAAQEYAKRKAKKEQAVKTLDSVAEQKEKNESGELFDEIMKLAEEETETVEEETEE